MMKSTNRGEQSYLNRELSWLSFNERVLEESIDPNNPLLEQLKFIAITSSNLDEFFMIRVAGLRHQKENNITRKDIAGMLPEEQLQEISETAQRLVSKQYMYLKQVLNALEREGLFFVKPWNITKKQYQWLKEYFEREISPVITPMAVDSSHPFPFLASKSLNLALLLEKIERVGDDDNDIDVKTAIVPVPAVLDRIISLPDDEAYPKKHAFVLLEDVIRHFAQNLFMGYDLLEARAFRITRDADLYIDEEDAQDLVVEVERQLKKRQKGEAVRIEFERGTSRFMQRFMTQSMNLEKEDLYEIDGPLDTTVYFSFCGIKGYDTLRYEFAYPHTPWSMIQSTENNIFDMIREKDMLVHLPYESFDESVVNFVMSAATDPDVLAIKQTLYRVSSKSPIILALEKAAQNGKQVTVLMEVKARFDEENNIHMARRLEKAGCHVIYGLKGLKTHSKITMVVRREDAGIRRYVHLATGNYNGKTARMYTDCGIFTCNDEYGDDASRFFNLISGYSDPPIWNKFIVAPLNLREKIMELIDREIEFAKQGEEAYIIGKMNSLLDKEVIAKLYEASAAGVRIDLIVRGICTLRPSIAGVSDNITVRSVVGRFLEHHRLFYFHNGGNESLFLSSADWMPRNLNERVELMIPIEDKRHKERVKGILDLYLEDTLKAHIMRADGSYRKINDREHPISAQEELMKEAIAREHKESMTVIERLQPMFKMNK